MVYATDDNAQDLDFLLYDDNNDPAVPEQSAIFNLDEDDMIID